MTLLYLIQAESASMWSFRTRKHREALAHKEAQIQAVRKQTLKKIDAATTNTRKLNQVLDDGGVTGLIWAATGGDRRAVK